MDTHKQLKRGAILSYVAIVFNILVTLIYTPWMVKNIGQSNYGLYTLASSLISVFMMDFGISAAVSRFLSKYRAENNIQAMREVLGASLVLYAIIDIIILVIVTVVYFNIDSIYSQLTDEELSVFRILFVIVALFDLISFPAITQNGILTSFERFTELKLCDLGRKVLTIIFVVLALSYNYGVIAVVLGHVVSGLLTILIKGIIIHKIGFSATFKGLSKPLFRSILGFSIWITLISFAQKFIYNMAPSVLGIVSGAIAISIFAPASALSGFFYTIAQAINGLFLPRVSRMVAIDDNEGISSLMVRVGRFQVFVLGIVIIGFVCVGRDFLIQWMGPEYEDSYFCALLMFLPAMFEYSQEIGNTTIIAKNKVKYQAIGFCVISIFTLGLSFLLGRIWGAIGLCISICIAGFLNVTLQSVIFSKVLGISMRNYYAKCFLPMIIPFAISIGGSIIITGFSPLREGWLRVIIHGLVISGLYTITCKFVMYKRVAFKHIIHTFLK